MKIYLASAEPKNLQLAEEILLSFYDIYIYQQFHFGKKPLKF